MNSLARVMKADITIPDFSSITLPRHILTKAKEPGSIVIVDSTGLKVYGKDAWHQEKHAVPARRTWHRLHLAIDENHQILACELTTPKVGDPTAVPYLLDQITTPFDTLMGDGAYDGEPVSQAVLNKQPMRKQWFHRTRAQFIQTLATRSKTSLFKPLRNKGESHGSKNGITCAVMLSLPCSDISAFLAMPVKFCVL